jgi:nitronate monooxygenase
LVSDNKEWLERELLAAGNAPIAIGFISWALQKCPDLLNVALAREPKAIFLSFGEIRSFASQIRRPGIPLIAQIQTVAQATAAVNEGAQFIVAQGTEAGGHGGTRSTFPLVPAVVDAVGNIPVIATGGIADGRGLAAALMLGAAGVLCGNAAAEHGQVPGLTLKGIVQEDFFTGMLCCFDGRQRATSQNI